MENEHGYVNVNILPMAKIVRNVYHFTMMHHGVGPHQIVFTNVNVSNRFCLISHFFSRLLLFIVLLFNKDTKKRKNKFIFAQSEPVR